MKEEVQKFVVEVLKKLKKDQPKENKMRPNFTLNDNDQLELAIPISSTRFQTIRFDEEYGLDTPDKVYEAVQTLLENIKSEDVNE